MQSNVYIPTSPIVKDVICSIWQINDLTAGKQETIIPKGVVEIIFDLSDCEPVQTVIGNKNYQLTKCFINGYNTCPIQLQLPSRHFFVGIQFHPIAIKQLFGIHAGEFSNLAVDLTLIDKTVDSLWHQLVEATDFNERASLICKWVNRRSISTNPQELSINTLVSNTGQPLSMKYVTRTIPYSPRHISRKVYELTGMNTEQFMLYKKYLHAVQLIHHTERSLTEIAYDSDFADQSHFTRSFKSFTHITPREYRKNKGHVPGHMLKNVRLIQF